MPDTPSLSVISGLDHLPRVLRYGTGSFTDVNSSSDPKTAPIVTGIWTVDDIQDNCGVFVAEADEVKFITQGESKWKDNTGKTFCANKGDILWFPKGSSSTLVSSKDLSAFYVEATHREVSTVTKSKEILASISEDLRAQLIEQYITSNPQSQQVMEKASKFLPNSVTRTVLHYDPFPLVLKSGRECYVTSVDNREYLDFVSEFSAGMLGHSHPAISKVAESTMARGISLGGPSVEEGKLAALLTARLPSIEKIRFCNSGTEANTMALTVACAYKKKTKILVFMNGYHGGFLGFGKTPNPGTLPLDFVMGEFNNTDQCKTFIDDTLAAIIIEPVQGAGVIPASREFLQFLRQAADRTGAILIFDEVVTSRLHHSGMQGYHGITPDMTTIGKFFGGGFSFGAFGGKAAIMDILDSGAGGISHSGTFNNNAFSMRAGAVACELVSEEAITRTNALGDRLRDHINMCGRLASPPLIWATGIGSMVGIHFAEPLKPKLIETFFFFMLKEGIYIGKRGFLALNIMHTAEHVERASVAIRRFVESLLTEDAS